MPSPRFSLVIPTRNRATTLAFALRTCLTQKFEDFEVVVSDNDSSPETREVVDAVGDKRIKYVRTPAPLAMTDSLEFAVSHAIGEYVSIIGDDDGYLPHSLIEMEHLLRLTDSKALRWESVVYNWPDIAKQSYAQPSMLLIPLRQDNGVQTLKRFDSAPRIQAAANGHISYADLPMIFCAVVHQSVFTELRRKTGRVFKSRTPDVYGAFAIAHVAGSYHSIDAPLAIAGTSGHSTGIARHFVKGSSVIDREFRRLNDEAGHKLHACVPDLPPIASAVADAFLYTRDALFPDDPSLTLDRKQLLLNCLAETEVDNDEEWQSVLGICRRSLSDDLALLSWFEEAYGGCAFAARPTRARRQPLRRYGGTFLSLDAADFGVTDVAGAALLCEKLLGYERDGLTIRRREGNDARETPLSVLQEKEAEIQGLAKVAAERAIVIEKLDEHARALTLRVLEFEGIERRRLGRRRYRLLQCLRNLARRFIPKRSNPPST